jgi:histidinol-phosphate aminotransferase
VTDIENVLQLIRPGIRNLHAVNRGLVDDSLHRLQWNESPFDYPSDLKEEVMQRLAQLDWARYPRGSRPWTLIDRLAERWRLDPGQVVVSEGSADLIKVIMEAAISPGATVVMPAPTFLLYRQNARMQQANIVEIPLSAAGDYALPVEELALAARKHHAPLVVLCAPNNPTGTPIFGAALAELAAEIPGLLVIDEAYGEFAGQDLTPLLTLGNVILLRTFSKAYAMAGVRVGYALTSPALAEELQKAVTVFPISVFSEMTALVALDHHERFMAVCDQLCAERERLAAALRELPGVRPFTSVTNFILVQLDCPKHQMIEHLIENHKVLISDMAGYPELVDCVRITIGTREQNELVIKGFGEIARGVHSEDWN